MIKSKSQILTIAILILLSSALKVEAQLTGIKTIPGDYASISLAVTDLNTQGVGAGGVTFDVAAGYTETISATISLTATGTLANPVIFQKSGAGANPLITSYTGGTATPGSAIQDGIWRLVGSDYITIDGIDLAENAANTTNPSTMEYGYALYKAGVADGAQNNTIKNCTITLNRINNAAATAPMQDGSIGIYVGNSLPTTATTSITPTGAPGTNSNNKFYTNTIQNCNIGIGLSGFAALTPFATGDTGNDIGGTSALTGNTILNFGGAPAAANAAAGIRANNQWGINISWNNINNNNGSGVDHVTTLRGIYGQAGTSANAAIENNIVTVKSGATTSALIGIENVIGATAAGNTVSVSNNTVQNCTYTTATTGTFTGILSASTATNVNVNNNIVNNNILPGTGEFNGIYSSASAINLTMSNNQVTNNQKTGASGSLFSMRMSTSIAVLDGNTINNNTIPSASGSTTTAVYGIYSLSSPTGETFTNNTITNLSIGGSNTSTSLAIIGIRTNSTAASNKIISNNIVHSLTINSTGGSGAVNGIWTTTGTNITIARNKVGNFSAEGTGSTVFGLQITSGINVTASNNLIGDLRAPSASAANAIVGLSVASTSANTSYYLYYNTVSLNAVSTGTNFGTSALSVAGSATATSGNVTSRNNIFVNNSTPNGTGFTVAFRRSTGAANTLNNYNAASNNNLFYAGSPGVTRLIYYDGTSTAQTISAYQLGTFTAGNMAPRDGASISEDVPFTSTIVTSPTFLQINTGLPSGVSNGAVNISGITIDYNGDIRQGNPGYVGTGTAPDIGADEYEYVASTSNDVGALLLVSPSAPIGCSTASQSVTIRIKNYGSVVDFATTPVTVTCNITGAVTATLTATLNTGTLGANASLDVPLTGTFDMSVNGVYTFNAFTSITGDITPGNDAMPAETRTRVGVIPGSVSSSQISLCGPGTPVLTLTGSANGTIQWQESQVSNTGPWTNVGSASTTYTPSSPVTQVTYYRAEVTCLSVTLPTNVVTINYSNPTLTSTSPATHCGIASVTLSAVPSAGNVVHWYDVPSGGTILATSNSFSTPIISNTVTYYAAASDGGFSSTVGMPAALSSSSSGSGTTNTGIVFDALTTFTISSVNIYPISASSASGTVIIDVIDGNNSIIQTATFNVTGAPIASLVPYTAILNFVIPPGTNYKMRPRSFTGITGLAFGPSASAPSGNYGYPFTIPGVISLNTSTLTAAPTNTTRVDLYYYFYNWVVSTGCETARVPITATITTAPPISATTTNSLVCSGGPTTLNASSSNPDYSYTWTPGNLTGASVIVNPSTTTTYSLSAVDTTTGSFATCTAVSSVTITTLPSGVTVSSFPESICGTSGSTLLSLSPSTGYTGATIQWQTSTDNISFSNISGANAVTYTTPVITATTYYKALVILGSDTCQQPSVAVAVGVPTMVGTSDGTRCGVGSVALTGSSSAGSVVRWYSNSTGGLPIGTGNTFNTPVVNSTTTFYASAESGGFSSYTSAIGAGSTTSATYSNPFYSLYSNTHTQYLILASELNAAGITGGYINSVALNITAAGTLPMLDLSVKIANTSAVNMTAIVSAPFTTVYTSPSLLPVVGLNTLNFSNPFVWDGVSNVVLEFCHGNPSSTATMSRTCQTDPTSFVSTFHVHRTTSSAASVTCSDNTSNILTYSIRPKFTFNYLPVCANSTRVPVIANVTPAPAIDLNATEVNLCPGSTSDLSVSSATNDPNYTYEWTSRPAGFSASGPGPHTISPTSNTTYIVTATDNSGGVNASCVAIDSVLINASTTLAAGTVSSSMTTYCISGTPVLTVSGNSGGSVQWQQSTISATGPWTNVGTGLNTYTPASPITQTTYFRVSVGCQTTFLQSNVVTVTVNTPTILTTTPGTRCGNGTVTISATAEPGATINWYANSSGGTPIATGPSFTTPSINSTTSYYASSTLGGSSANVGLVAPPSYYNVTTGNYGIIFDAITPFTLNTVDLYPSASVNGTAGTVTIALTDAAGTVLQSTTVNVIGYVTPLTLAAKNTVTLNFNVPIGTGLRLTRTATTGIASLQYECGLGGNCSTNFYSGSYPTSIPGVLTQVGGHLGSATVYNYYVNYFYNWNVSTGCEGPRVAVAANVTTPPTIAVTAADLALCPGASTTVSVSSPNDPNYTYSWTSNPAGFTATGAGPHTISPTVTTNYIVTASDNSGGANAGCVKIDSVTVITASTLSAGTVSSNVPSICVSGTPILTLTGSSGGIIQWQRSTITPAGPWTNAGSGGTTYTPSAPISQTTYYRATVSCQSTTINSNVVTVIVNNPQLLSATGGSRCGFGSVNLNASGSAGSTIKWYTSASGGLPIGSGSPFASPSIGTTTNYYAAAEVGAISPTTSSIGAGTTTSATYSNPFYSAWSNTHNQHLILASELNAAGITGGMITSIALDITSAGTLPMIDLSVKMGNTTATNMSAFVAPAFTTVYSSASLLPVVGLNTLTFSTPFIWDGVSNVVVEFCHGNSTSTTTMSRTCKTDPTSFVSTIHVQKSAATAAAAACSDLTTNLLTYSVRPQFTFTYLPVCSSPRTAVLATVTAAPTFAVSADKVVCNDEVAMISVTSNTADYNSYIWSPVVGLYTDPAGTNPYTGTSTTTVYARTTTPGNIFYYCNASNTSTGCGNIDSAAIFTQPVAAVITHGQSNFCLSGSTTLSLNPATPYATGSVQWRNSLDNISYTDIAGANSTTYNTGTINATTYYQAQIRNGDNVICFTTATDTLIVNNPTVVTTAPASRCGIGTVTLGATASGTSVLNWYTAATGGSPIATGASYTTPIIAATTNYFVSASSGGTSNISVASPTAGTSVFWSAATGWGLRFTVNTAVTINSVKIYASNTTAGAATLQVKITDLADVVLYTGSVNNFNVGTSLAEQLIAVNISLPPGNYKMGMVSTGISSLVRESGGVTFPYNSPGNEVSITAGANGTGTAQTTSAYYWFYNWVISTGCESVRTQVDATVTPAPPVSITGTSTICQGSSSTLSIGAGLADYTTFTWSPATGLSSTTGSSVIATPSVTTKYYVLASGNANSCQAVDSFIVNVDIIPLTVTTNNPLICGTGSAQLTASPGSGSFTYSWSPATGLSATNIANPVATPTVTTDYTVTVTDNVSGCTKSAIVTIYVSNPQLLSSNGSTQCGVGPANLTATASSGTIFWWGNAAGGTALATGSPFNPNITATTTFYTSVKDVLPQTPVTTGFQGGIIATDPNAAGNMFNIVAAHDVKITGFDVHLNNTNGLAASNIAVYYKAGTYVGSTLTASAWTLAGTANGVVSAGAGVPTPLPLTLDINIPAGQTYGFYIVVTNLGVANSLRYNSGATSAAEGVVAASDNNISVGTGTVIFGPFTGALAAPVNRLWNGNVKYTIGCETARTPVVATVNAPPALAVTAGSSGFCVGGGSTTIDVTTGSSDFDSFTWSPSTGLNTTTGTSVIASPATTTTYTVTATNSVTGCVNISSATVNVVPDPIVTFATPTSMCGNDPAQLLTVSAPVSRTYNWGTQAAQNVASANADGFPAPYTLHYGAQRMQMLITAAELQAAGYATGTKFTGIQFPVAALGTNWGGTVTSLNGFQVSIGFTALNSLAAFQSGLTQVVAPANFTPVVGYANTHTFATQPVWDGVSNLVVETTFGNNIIGNVNNLTTQYNTPTAFQSTIVYRADAITASAAAVTTTISFAYNARPDFKLTALANASTVWSPTTGLFTNPSGTTAYTGGPATSVYAHPSDTTTYTVTATNYVGCTGTGSVTVNLTPTPKPKISSNDTLLCFPNEILLYAIDSSVYSGGYPAGTTVEWIGIVSGLSPTTGISSSNGSVYQAKVTLPNGCFGFSNTVNIITRSVTVIPAISPAACNSNSGKVVANVTAGSAPFHYVWTDGINTIRDTVSNNIMDSITQLAAGTYYLTIYDNYGLVVQSCNSGSIPLIVPNTATLIASINTYSNITCNGSGDGSATVTVNGGGGTYTYLWSNGQSSASIFGLSAGTYTVTVSDQYNCSDTATVTIIEPGLIIITPLVSNVSCNGGSDGSITANFTGGTGPYQIDWYDAGFTLIGTGTTISSLSAGDYYLVITDANSCFEFTLVTITMPPAIVISGFSPTNGSGGTSVIISGSNFTGATNVLFNGTPATSFTVDNAGQITAVAPAGGSTGVISVVNGSCSVSSTGVFTYNISATLNVTAIIEGYYSGGGQMVATLSAQGVAAAPNECDTITVELRDQFSPATVVASVRTVLHVDGQAAAVFPGALSGGSYYVVVLHRNALQTWSALPVTLSGNTSYNFTTANGQSFGNNMKLVDTGIWAMYSGDIEPQDEFIDVFDQSTIDNDAGIFAFGYYSTDVNGDGFVDVFDQAIVDNNATLFIFSAHP